MNGDKLKSKVNSYFLCFLSLSFEDYDVTREKRHAFLKLRVFQPNGRLLWGFVYVSCGQFDQWSTSWFCCSLPVLWGLQVKPPSCQSGWSRLRATLRSWLSRTFAFFILPKCSISLLPAMMHCALFVSSRFISGGLNLTSDVQCDKPFKGFLNNKMLIPHVSEVRFAAFLPFINSPLSPDSVSPPPFPILCYTQLL